MNKLKLSLVVACLAVASLANAQVSDSTAIAGISSAAPTLDCAANQMKVGSACAVLIYSGAVENAGCTASGLITLGVAASGQLLSCQGGAWKLATGTPAAATPAGMAGNGCASAGGAYSSIGGGCGVDSQHRSLYLCMNGTLDWNYTPAFGVLCWASGG